LGFGFWVLRTSSPIRTNESGTQNSKLKTQNSKPR
jgi:hypothetical protein